MNDLPDNDYIAVAIFDGDPLLGLYPNRVAVPKFTIPPVTPPPDGVVGTSLPMLVTSVAGVVLSVVASKVR